MRFFRAAQGCSRLAIIRDNKIWMLLRLKSLQPHVTRWSGGITSCVCLHRKRLWSMPYTGNGMEEVSKGGDDVKFNTNLIISIRQCHTTVTYHLRNTQFLRCNVLPHARYISNWFRITVPTRICDVFRTINAQHSIHLTTTNTVLHVQRRNELHY